MYSIKFFRRDNDGVLTPVGTDISLVDYPTMAMNQDFALRQLRGVAGADTVQLWLDDRSVWEGQKP